MAKSINLTDFQGGIGTLGEKRDKPGTARFTKNLDPYEDTSYVTLSRKTTKVSDTTVTDLPLWMVDGSPFTTDRFVYDLGGSIYTVDSNDSFSLDRTVSGGAGEGLVVFDDYLYYAQGTELGRYGRLSGTPAFDDAMTSWWDAAITDIQDSGGGTGATDYSTTTSINEGATHKQTFTPTHDPLKEITIDVDVVGTGDWTITVHDSEDNTIGSVTITNGSMSTGDVTFTFSTPLRLIIGNTYHFHVTTTVADGGVDTSTNDDLEAAEFTVEYGVLIDNDYHPMVVLEDLLIIGNERYLATFDQASYDPTTIAFDAGFQVRTLVKTEEYVIAECFKGSSVLDAEEAKRYYWDGIATSFNFSEPIKIGAPNATVSFSGEQIAGVYGFEGSLYEGKTGRELTERIPKLGKGKNIEVFPGAIDKYQNRVLIGIAGSTDDSSDVELGVYEYGGQSTDTPKGLNLPYVISTGNTQATNLKIGMVKAIGKDIYLGFREDSSYGVDKITLGDDAATSGIYESLIFDDGNAKKDKHAIKLKATFEALASGESATLAWKIDRAANFTSGTAVSTTGETEAIEHIHKRFKEIEFKFTLSSSSATFPKITSLVFDYEPLEDEDID